ncbi:Slp family lipoprotein [Pseudomonadota bacterium]
MNRLWYFIALILLSGCAARVPAPINITPPTSLTVAQVQVDPTQHVGTQVRWGGEITQVENKTSHTWVEIVNRTLQKNGEPYRSGHSGGRFIASFPGFVDPKVYAKGKTITIVGSVEGGTRHPIGEYEYQFPIIAVTSSYLWPDENKEPQYIYPLPPWYYDPWWPYYPRPPIPHHRRH